MKYKDMILEMLDKIIDENGFMAIFAFINFLYTKKIKDGNLVVFYFR